MLKVDVLFNQYWVKLRLLFCNNIALESHEYHMKIVPTIYEDTSGEQSYSYQYTYALKSHTSTSYLGTVIPAIWFKSVINIYLIIIIY